MTPARDPARPTGPVVTGVDGSEPSKAALAWAADYARLSGAPLEVIVAWHIPSAYDWTVPMPDDWDPEADAKEMLEREVTEVLGPTLPPDVTLSVVEGPPARVLADASRSASLVVVGSRGRGEFAGMLLGSVSAFVATHARCPVVVVRDRDGADGD